MNNHSVSLTFHDLHLAEDIQQIEFISDLHLDNKTPKTLECWKRYMQNSRADAIFILGDLFESWIGDDILEAPAPIGNLERHVANVLKTASQKIYFIHGNRDFLIQDGFAQAADITLLPDPTRLFWKQQQAILTHGDLLCIDDINYQTFRKTVRAPQWQQQALSMPLQARMAMAEQMRMQSQEATKQTAAEIMDVNESEVDTWLQAANTKLLIHGHTHRPATHQLQNNSQRIVLTDWDLENSTKAEVLSWEGDGLQRTTLI